MNSLGDEIKMRREFFHVQIRKQQVREFLVKRRQLIRPRLQQEDLDLLLQNLGAQDNIVFLSRNRDLITIDYFQNDLLLIKLAEFDPKFKKYIIKILGYIMTNVSISSLIINEMEFLRPLCNVLSNLQPLESEKEIQNYWIIIETICSHPNTKIIVMHRILEIMVQSVICTIQIDQSELEMLKIPMPTYPIMNIAEILSPNYYVILAQILRKQQSKMVIQNGLNFILVLFKSIQQNEDLSLIVNKDLIKFILDQILNLFHKSQEIAICLLNYIMKTKYNKKILKSGQLFNALYDIVKHSVDREFVNQSFQLLTRLKDTMDRKLFSAGMFNILIYNMLIGRNLQKQELALEFLVRENHQIDFFQEELEQLVYSKYQRISELSQQALKLMNL